MKLFSFTRHGLLLVSALCSLAYIPVSQAINETVTATFRPDPNNPGFNKFKNTASISGMCQSHVPAGMCERLGIFSLRIPYSITSTGPIEANHTDERKGFMVKTPSNWRSVLVTHRETGRTEELEFRIAAIGGSWGVPHPPGVSAWGRGPTHGEPTWSSQWINAPAPCTTTRAHASGATFAFFFWVVPEGAGTCSRQPTVDLPWLRMGMIEYGYELRTPNPLTMATGQYTGTTLYSLGPMMDFDFGDLLIPGDDQLVFDFVLNVEHELKVEVPPGGDRIELLPEGGWQAWLNRGRKPGRLFRDQTVNIWSSSQFKMTLECSLPMGNTCGISDSNGNEVPVDVAVTLPAGLTDAVGRPVNRLPLRLDGSGTELFQPTRYVDRKPSTLHFEITRDHVEQMLKPGEASNYSGSMTVIWDSEV